MTKFMREIVVARLRWLLPVLIFGGFTWPLVRLTFHNDEALASTFHHLFHEWAVVVHAAILLFPVGLALLPQNEPGKLITPRRVAYGVWGCTLMLALFGNVLGNVAYTSARTVGEVLDAKPTSASALRLWLAGFGGFLLVALETAAGYLLERVLSWLLFGHSPAEEAALPSMRVDSGRQELPAASSRELTEGRQAPRLSSGVDSRRQPSTVKRQAVRLRRGGGVKSRPSKGVDSRQGVSSGVDGGRQPSSVNRQPSSEVDSDEEPSVKVIGIPAEMPDELIEAVEALARWGSTRVAGEQIGVSRTTISNRVKEAREVAPEWVAQQLGEGGR